MKFIYFNDTGREVSIHPRTNISGIKCDINKIKHLEERTFYLPEGTYPYIKMWDYGEKRGLSILVLAKTD